MGKDIIKIVGFERTSPFPSPRQKGFSALTTWKSRSIKRRIPPRKSQVCSRASGMSLLTTATMSLHGMKAKGLTAKFTTFLFLWEGARELNQGLFVSSGINEISALKDKILGVDASTTGFAVVLRYILQRNNLLFERDYSFKRVGSSRVRLAELVAGNIAGAMLNPRYVEASGASTLRQLAAGKDYVDPYPTRVGLTTRKWARSHGSLLVRFIGAILQAVNWILESKNKRETIEIINTRMGRSPMQAEEDYHRLLGSSAGLTDRCAFDPHSLSTVLEMRRRLGMIQSPLPSLDKYYDDSFYREAVSLSR